MMKKMTTLVMLLFIIVLSHAQKVKPSEQRRMMLGLSYSAFVTHRSLKYSADQDFVAEMRNKTEVPKYGYAVGVVAQKPIGNKSAIEVGVSFSNTGFRTKETQLTWEPGNDAYPAYTSSTFSFLHLGLSVRYRYIIAGKRIQYYIMPGMAMQTLVERKTTIRTENNNKGMDKTVSAVRGGFAETGVTAIIAAGAKYNFSNRYAVCLEPLFRRQLNSIISGIKQDREFLYAFGLNAILLFSLKK